MYQNQSTWHKVESDLRELYNLKTLAPADMHRQQLDRFVGMLVCVMQTHAPPVPHSPADPALANALACAQASDRRGQQDPDHPVNHSLHS